MLHRDIRQQAQTFEITGHSWLSLKPVVPICFRPRAASMSDIVFTDWSVQGQS